MVALPGNLLPLQMVCPLVLGYTGYDVAQF